MVYRDQGRWLEALACFEAVAEQRRAEGARDSLGRALNNQGEVLLFQGRLSEAQAAFRSGLAEMTTNLYAIDTHLNLGLSYQISGELGPAEQEFTRALELALALGRRDNLAEIYYRLGEVRRRQDDATDALHFFSLAAEVIEALRLPLRTEALKIGLLGRWQQVYETLVLQCLAMGRVAEAFTWAERARARACADAVAQPSQITSEMRHATIVEAAVVSLDEVQSALPIDALLLCYFTTGVLEQDAPLLQAVSHSPMLRDHWLTPARTVVFALTRTTLSAATCAVDPNTFASLSMRPGQHRMLAPSILQRLSTLLLSPIEEARNAKQLIIIPHGPLHAIPFAALTTVNGQPIVHAGGPTLCYAPSATLWQHLSRPGWPEHQVQPGLAVGYDGPVGQTHLRHTETEAVLVADLIGGQAWVGPQPKLDALRTAAAEQDWLHFACHGSFDLVTPLASYLETGVGERLTALEVLQNWRLRAEGIVLSACETGVSHLLRGDEPMGLVRAFLSAGARAVLVSQWPVEDLPTFLLMQRFYRELRSNRREPAAALHAAQVWLRTVTAVEAQQHLAALPTAGLAPDAIDTPFSRDPTGRPFAHPRHWAGFILVAGAQANALPASPP